MAEPLDIARVGGGSALILAGIGLLKWFADRWIALRRSPEQKASDAAKLDAQSIENAAALMAGMREDLDALRDAQRDMKEEHRKEMDAARRLHDECEARCNALAEDLRRARREMAALIRQLRSGLTGGSDTRRKTR